MKRIFWVSALCIAFITVMPVIAQDNGGGNPYYYVNVPIERIYPYRKGYIIDYQTGATGTRTARTYIPLEWFEDGQRVENGMPRGEIILLGPGNSWPYLTVYYNEGEFSHVRLYIRRERSHGSWGGVPTGMNLDEYFEDVSDLKLTFSNDQ
ncbi:MAG: hypothetical protein LBD55_11530 [Treponema sp.]|jgi:hypothetical protein|nr:hypothetical protein [Treponema sp.]